MFAIWTAIIFWSISLTHVELTTKVREHFPISKVISCLRQSVSFCGARSWSPVTIMRRCSTWWLSATVDLICHGSAHTTNAPRVSSFSIVSRMQHITINNCTKFCRRNCVRHCSTSTSTTKIANYALLTKNLFKIAFTRTIETLSCRYRAFRN